VPGLGLRSGLKTSVFLEVEGAAHYLPAYAGNLDIMTSAALAAAEAIAARQTASGQGAFDDTFAGIQ
jgi:acetaldehyde dehydrogenase